MTLILVSKWHSLHHIVLLCFVTNINLDLLCDSRAFSYHNQRVLVNRGTGIKQQVMFSEPHKVLDLPCLHSNLAVTSDEKGRTCRILFTRNQKLYNSNLPPRRPELETPTLRASFWELSVQITLFGVRPYVEYSPLEQQYLEVITKALSSITPKGFNVARMTAVPMSGYVPPPIERGAPAITFNVTGPESSAPPTRRLLQAQPNNTRDRVGVVLPMQLFLLADAPGEMVDRAAADQLEARILADGGTAIWSGMQVAGANDAAKTFVVPTQVAVSVSRTAPKFNVLPDPTTTTQVAGNVTAATSNGGQASTAAAAAIQKREPQGLATWKVVVIASAATVALLAALLTVIFCCRCGCCGLMRRTEDKSSKEAGIISGTPARPASLDASILRYSSSGAEVLVSPYARSTGAANMSGALSSSKGRGWTSVGLGSIYSSVGSGHAAAAAGPGSQDLVRTSANSTNPNQAGFGLSASKHMKAVASATANLVCDVGITAAQQPLRSSAVSAQMAVLLCELDELAATGELVFQKEYKLVLQHSALSLAPHSVRVQGMAPDGSSVEVHFAIIPALFESENLLFHKPVRCSRSFLFGHTLQCTEPQHGLRLGMTSLLRFAACLLRDLVG
jgi:hypothetical protein